MSVGLQVRHPCRFRDSTFDLGKFFNEEYAGTAVEYAVFTLVLLLAAVVGFFTLSTATHLVLQTVVGHVSDQSELFARSYQHERYGAAAESLENAAITGSYWVRRFFEVSDHIASLVAGCIGVVLATVTAISLARPGKRREDLTSEPLPQTQQDREAAHRRHLFVKRNLLRRLLRRALDDRTGINLPVRHFMSEELETVHPTTPLPLVAARMRQKGIRHLLVTNNRGELLGVISAYDLQARSGRVAKDIMTPQPLTTTPETPISQAITLLVQKGISCLPVRDQEQLRGILTTTDVLIGFQALVHAWEVVFQTEMVEEELDEAFGEGCKPPAGQTTASVAPSPADGISSSAEARSCPV